MAGNWMDERERRLRERERDWRTSDYTGHYAGEERSWDRDERPGAYGARHDRRQRDRVFGEGESGADYGARPADAADRGRGSAARGWQDRHYGGISPAMQHGAYGASPQFNRQDYTAPRHGREAYSGGQGRGGGRFYGDDDREPIYRQEYGQGGVEYGDVPRGYDAERSRAHAREERFEDAGRGAGQFLHRAGERMAAWFGAGSESRIYDPEYQGGATGARGLGPHGYKRSDERINEDAHERLTDDPWVDASGISVSVSAGEVTLSGTVENREAKHRAERIVEDIAGVAHVQNNLRVAKGGFLTSPTSGYGDSALAAQMRRDDPASNGSGVGGGDPSSPGKKP